MKKIFCIAATVAALTIQAEAQETKENAEERIKKHCPKEKQEETENGVVCKKNISWKDEDGSYKVIKENETEVINVGKMGDKLGKLVGGKAGKEK